MVDGYLDVIDRLEDLSDEVEEPWSFGRTGPRPRTRSLRSELFRLKRKVVRFRRAVAPMREVIDLLGETPTIVTPPLVPYYRDVQDHVIRAIELTDNIRELLTSALEAGSRRSRTSSRRPRTGMNVVMKQLSGWAAIILVPTLIAGIYGMNFRHMPELGWQIGYPFALGTMAVSALILYRVFKQAGLALAVCRALKVLCVAEDDASLEALKRATVSADWELVAGATTEDEAVRQLHAERPHVLVAFGPSRAWSARARGPPGPARDRGPGPARGERRRDLARRGARRDPWAAAPGRSRPLSRVAEGYAHPPHALHEPVEAAMRIDTMTLARPLKTERSGCPKRSARPGQ